ncbi:MAG: Glucokinase [Phycisphaerae bacterium]|nr:Glucokinase [Phycisphaerae bacterium]
MPPGSRILGLDLGGTNIKAVLVDEHGDVLAKQSYTTEAQQGPQHVITRMSKLCEAICQTNGVNVASLVGIGIGSPGPLDIRRGIIIKSANLPGWENIPLRDEIQRRVGRPAVLLNDATAATYGEDWVGAGQRAEHLVLLTLGTGVGGGIVCNGEIVQGYYGNAGELGHMIIVPDGRHCRCGQQGCLESYAASSYLVPLAEEAARSGRGEILATLFRQNGRLEMEDITRAAGAGDRVALALWDEACRAIAIAIVNLQHAFNPKIVLLGGGISAAGEILLQPVRQHFEKRTWRMMNDQPEIRLASLGNDAGAVGAAGWFLHLHERGVV